MNHSQSAHNRNPNQHGTYPSIEILYEAIWKRASLDNMSMLQKWCNDKGGNVYNNSILNINEHKWEFCGEFDVVPHTILRCSSKNTKHTITLKLCRRGFEVGNPYQALEEEPEHARELDQHTRVLENYNTARELESCIWAYKVTSKSTLLWDLVHDNVWRLSPTTKCCETRRKRMQNEEARSWRVEIRKPSGLEVSWSC